ncbi:MAG: hypothetical protein QW579_07740 [Desulfurococcaceae archaeon]
MSSQVDLQQAEIKGFIIMLVPNTDDTAVELMKRHLKLPMLTSRSYILGLVDTGSALADVFEKMNGKLQQFESSRKRLFFNKIVLTGSKRKAEGMVSISSSQRSLRRRLDICIYAR